MYLRVSACHDVYSQCKVNGKGSSCSGKINGGGRVVENGTNQDSDPDFLDCPNFYDFESRLRSLVTRSQIKTTSAQKADPTLNFTSGSPE